MQIRKWAKPGSDEVRYYLDLRHGAPFLNHDAASLLHGRWIGMDDAGMAHIYTKPQHGSGRARTEDGDWLDTAMLGTIQTFADWETIYTACLTKSGNFSVAKFLKR